ncbi:hypothetical protein [Psychromarinibacter halotolerans]|uniref:Uncharacterized protein n=1 Tax=Psychromarinibacter halotolerans TaxID=1775175 RepID=A0ABV7H030_9RHOB|nr:hypothetical protein [Psychromarinibacter halotolerans]MAQ82983.1 hypothetical protein [Maritimibacter sp.]MDF0598700.1 hypothetical protein [Psychromarinibacter halotolerans]
MRNAALMLGVIGGIVGMIVGLFSTGYLWVVEWLGGVDEVALQVENADIIRVAGFLSPILAVAGGAMARSQATAAAVLMALSAGGMYYAFGFNPATMFPIGMCGLGAVLALVARQPDAA